MFDRYRFLDPWTQLLPTRGGPVVAVAGSGGKSTLVRRIVGAYRDAGHRVLVSQTVPHPAPADLARGHADEPLRDLRDRMVEHGALFVAGPTLESGAWDGLSPEVLESVRGGLAPDVTLVEAHASTGTPLRHDGVAPLWPAGCSLAFLVANLGAVGRVWSSDLIRGVETPRRVPREEPRRIAVEDILNMFGGDSELWPPATARPIPFLTGFGGFRDTDGMFDVVTALVRRPGVRVVCLAELVGDERRDQADLRSLVAADARAEPLSGERVYAVYPAELDEDQH